MTQNLQELGRSMVVFCSGGIGVRSIEGKRYEWNKVLKWLYALPKISMENDYSENSAKH
jgi:hypothetical protein